MAIRLIWGLSLSPSLTHSILHNPSQKEQKLGDFFYCYRRRNQEEKDFVEGPGGGRKWLVRLCPHLETAFLLVYSSLLR